MSGNTAPAGAIRHFGWLLLWPALAAGPALAESASARFGVGITVLPTFEVRQVTPVQGGREYRVWTNMKSAQLEGREYLFGKPGEAVVFVPDANGGERRGAPPAQAAKALQ